MLAILNYHNVARVPDGMRMPQLYVSLRQFAQQMRWLRRVGVTGVTLSAGMRRLRAGKAAGCIAITFDDGYADDLVHAAPILRDQQFAAACFIVSDYIGKYNAGCHPLLRYWALYTRW